MNNLQCFDHAYLNKTLHLETIRMHLDPMFGRYFCYLTFLLDKSSSMLYITLMQKNIYWGSHSIIRLVRPCSLIVDTQFDDSLGLWKTRRKGESIIFVTEPWHDTVATCALSSSGTQVDIETDFCQTMQCLVYCWYLLVIEHFWN